MRERRKVMLDESSRIPDVYQVFEELFNTYN